MKFFKKQAAGFYVTCITAVLALLGLVFYMVNAGTAYFANLGVDAAVVACLCVAAALYLVLLAASQKMGNHKALDALFVVASVLVAVALVRFGSSRVNGIAAIMTFENNAQTMADLSSAIYGLVFCGVAMLTGLVASFMKIVKS